MMNAIETEEISKSYGPVRALRDVTISVQPGEVVGLLGPNGAGKTTLMKILTGFLQPDAGSARVGGIDVLEHPLQVQRKIGYLPESAPLYPEMAVQEYLLMMAQLRQIDERRQRLLLSQAIYATGLERYLTRPIGHLSKGYRQRVGIAQAILHQPDLLILDEPTSGLDPTQIVEIRDLIRRLSQHTTVILSTHILSEVEMTCDRILIIIAGTLRKDANMADLRAANSAVVAVAADVAGVQDALRRIDGVVEVKEEEAVGSYRRWRVTSHNEDQELCPAIFDVVRDQNWRISELRPAPRTLEAVFRQVAEQSDYSVEAAA